MMIASLWSSLWPNVVAPSMWTLAGIGAHHLASRRQRERHHREMLDHVTRAVTGTTESEAR